MSFEPRKFTEEEKADFIAATRKTLENFKWRSPIIEFVEGPMYGSVLAWRNKKDRNSGDFPSGEFELKVYQKSDDAIAPFARAIESGEALALFLPRNATKD